MRVGAACSVCVAAGSRVLPEPRDGATPVRTIDRGRIDAVVPPRLRKKIDRFSQLALLAFGPVKGACAGAPPSRVGVFLGNDLAGWNYVYDQVVRMIRTRDPEAIDPYVATAWFPAAAQGELTIAHGLLGESKTFAAGCLSGGLALEYAARMVAAGRLAVAVAGGVEAPDAPVVLRALAVAQRISTQHPASEAAALLALVTPGRAGLAELTLSAPRRRLEAALEDVAAQLAGAAQVRCFLPSVAPGNEAWLRVLAEIVRLLRVRLGDRLDLARPPWAGLDLGSAGFPMGVIEACQASGEARKALVVWSDFEGLFLAGVVVPAGVRRD